MQTVAPPPRTVRAPRAAKKPIQLGKFDSFTDTGKAEIVRRLREATAPHWMQPGTWHSPIISHRQYASLRKRHPELELPKRMLRPRSAGAPPLPEKKIKPPKLHKYDRAEYREKRKADVQKAMKDMKKMIENQRKAGREERRKRREESPALMMNLPLRAPNKKYRLIKLQERRAKRTLEKAAAEATTAAAPPKAEKKPETKKKDSVGTMKV